MNDQKMTCCICGYGDGKWEESAGTKMPENLPVCALCKNDGWSIESKEIVDALKKDPRFQVMESSPYFNKKTL